MTRRPALMIAAIAVIGVAAFVVVATANRHQLRITCYFQNGQGLKPGSPVTVAGVQVGSVRNIRVRPERSEHPVEVNLLLQTSYELKIPSDSVVVLETAGILGETFAEIDTSKATGSPLQNSGTLSTRPSTGPGASQILDCLSNISQHKPCENSK